MKPFSFAAALLIFIVPYFLNWQTERRDRATQLTTNMAYMACWEKRKEQAKHPIAHYLITESDIIYVYCI